MLMAHVVRRKFISWDENERRREYGCRTSGLYAGRTMYPFATRYIITTYVVLSLRRIMHHCLPLLTLSLAVLAVTVFVAASR